MLLVKAIFKNDTEQVLTFTSPLYGKPEDFRARDLSEDDSRLLVVHTAINGLWTTPGSETEGKCRRYMYDTALPLFKRLNPSAVEFQFCRMLLSPDTKRDKNNVPILDGKEVYLGSSGDLDKNGRPVGQWATLDEWDELYRLKNQTGLAWSKVEQERKVIPSEPAPEADLSAFRFAEPAAKTTSKKTSAK